MTLTQSHIINRLRLSGPPTATAVYRLSADALLNQAELQPPEMPPAAILIARRLADPLPGGLTLGAGATLDRRWAAAARAALARLYQQAARPAAGPVPAGAAAVRFTDEAEMVACLLRDLARGEAWGFWWWQVPLRGLPPRQEGSLTAVFCRHARAIPPALAHLVRWGEAAATLAQLGAAGARQAAAALAAAYATPDPLADEPRFLAGTTAVTPPIIAPEKSQPPRLPWTDVLPEALAPPTLPPMTRCLLAWGLLLQRAPGVARQPAFVAALRVWVAAEMAREGGGGRTAVAPPTPSIPPATSPARPPTPDDWRLTAERPAAQPIDGRPDARPLPTAPDSAAPGGGQARPPAEPPGAIAPSPAAANPAPSASSGRPSSRLPEVALPDAATASVPPEWVRPASPPGPIAPAPDAADEAEAAAAPAPDPVAPLWTWAEGAQTGWGGLLFLLNLMRRMGLPDCFPDVAAQVGAWGVLELLGRGLLAEVTADWQEDPIWAALAELDGRSPHTLPGEKYEEMETLARPVAWSGVTPVGGAAGLPGLNPALGRWLDLVTPYARGWLAGLLAAGGEADWLARLLGRNGRLFITSSHVDLVLPLNGVYLPARLVGLDFDPGWLPAFGRVVQFHYR